MATTTTTPKYRQLIERLRRQIQSGEFKAGDRLPSFAEMSALHGATTTTLTRVYETLQREGLIVREQGRGTFVLDRKSIRSRGTIGIVGFYHNDDVPYYAYLLQGIRSVADREGYELLLINESRQIDNAKTADALLACTPYEQILRALPADIPQISLIFNAPDCPVVSADDFMGAKTATEHLLQLGHRRIAYLIPMIQGPIERNRVAGYQAALREAGIEPDPKLVRTLAGGWGAMRAYSEVGRKQMQDWLHDRWWDANCTALLAANDEMAIGIIRVLQEAKIDVPGQVSVVGFDGTRVGEYFSPQLTSIEVPLREIGARGAEELIKQIRDGEPAPPNLVLPVALKVRASTAAPPSAQPAPAVRKNGRSATR